MNAVVKKIEAILKSPYATKNYVDLIREIFPKVSMVSRLKEVDEALKNVRVADEAVA